MSGPTEKMLLLSSLALIVPFRVYALVWQMWSFPLRNGPGFFLGVEVPASFYDGPGVRWLQRYRAWLLGEHLLEALFVVTILAVGRWDMIPLMSVGAVTLTGTMGGFLLWTRHRLGANPPARSSVAVALETRRLSDYVSWPLEALAFGLIAYCWFLLLTRGDAGLRWQEPVILTWVVLGLLPGKIALVRSSFPIPSERAEEHYRVQDAQRRYSLRVMDAFGWFFVVILCVYALGHAWPAMHALAWWRWSSAAIAFSAGLYMAVVIIRGQGRLLAIGRDLRPAGSWSAPFRGAQWMSRPGLVWFAAWFGGIVLLLFLRT